MGVLLWIVIIGFVAGIVARLLMPGPNTPKGFIVTTILGIAGAFLASMVGDVTGLYRPGQGAGLIGATVGALVILFVWHRLVACRSHPRPRPVSSVSLSIQSSGETGRLPGHASVQGCTP